MPAVAWAQDPVTTAASAFTPEEKTRMQEQLKDIAKAMGVEESIPVKEGEKAPPQKSAADVADKALDMFGGLVTTISQTMEKAAPEVWRIMIKQQYAKAVADLLVPWSLLLLTFLYWILVGKRWNVDKHEWSETPIPFIKWTLPVIVSLVFAICGIVALSNTAKYIINPEYYAVRDILIMLINPRQVTQ